MNVHVYPSDLNNASRMLKIARTLEELGLFDSICLVGAGGRDGVVERSVTDRVKIVLLGNSNTPAGLVKKIARFLAWYVKVYRYFGSQKIVCINAHSLSCLPLCVLLKIKTGGKLIYDPHELETETTESTGIRRHAARVVENVCIRFADHVIVVSGSIADHYAQRYRIRRPTVVLNAPTTIPMQTTTLLRDELGIDPSAVIFLYLGVVGAGRGVDRLLAAFRERTDKRAVLVIVGYGPQFDVLREESATVDQIFFRDAVPPSEVTLYSSSADVGVALIEPICLSYEYCLPNKLFEYGMSGLPCLVSDVTEMRDYVRENKCGFVLTSMSAREINGVVDRILNSDLSSLSVASYTAATQHAWEVQEKTLTRVYRQLFPSPLAMP